MTTEITLVRLPVRLSDLVDEVIEEFVETHKVEKVDAYRRYHGADLWMVYAHASIDGVKPAFLTHRVTTAAFSDDPDYLRFIPDIVVTGPDGRFTLPDSSPSDGLRGGVDAISELQARLVSGTTQDRQVLKDTQHAGSIAAALEQAWGSAKRLTREQATQLIA